MNPCIVILGSSLTALSLVRIASRSGMRVILASSKMGIAHSSRYAEKVIFSENSNEYIINKIKKILDSHKAYCIADNDKWLKFIIANRIKLETFLTVLHPCQESLKICLDKNVFLRWCMRNKIRSPKIYQYMQDGKIKPEPKFPLLIRPELTQHETGKKIPKALEVKNFKELRYWINEFKKNDVIPAISESLLYPRIKQYSVGFVRRRDGATRLTIAEKIRSLPDQCAGGTYVVSSNKSEVEAFTLKLISKLNYYGIGEAEILYDEGTGKPYVIEVNARPWVQFSLAEHIQPQLLSWLLSKNKIELKKKEFKSKQSRWLNFNSDFYICFSRSEGIVTRGRYHFSEYLISIFKANVFAVYDRTDLKPFIKNLWRFSDLWFNLFLNSG